MLYRKMAAYENVTPESYFILSYHYEKSPEITLAAILVVHRGEHLNKQFSIVAYYYIVEPKIHNLKKQLTRGKKSPTV